MSAVSTRSQHVWARLEINDDVSSKQQQLPTAQHWQHQNFKQDRHAHKKTLHDSADDVSI